MKYYAFFTSSCDTAWTPLVLEDPNGKISVLRSDGSWGSATADSYGTYWPQRRELSLEEIMANPQWFTTQYYETIVRELI